MTERRGSFVDGDFIQRGDIKPGTPDCLRIDCCRDRSRAKRCDLPFALDRFYTQPSTGHDNRRNGFRGRRRKGATAERGKGNDHRRVSQAFHGPAIIRTALMGMRPAEAVERLLDQVTPACRPAPDEEYGSAPEADQRCKDAQPVDVFATVRKTGEVAFQPGLGFKLEENRGPFCSSDGKAGTLAGGLQEDHSEDAAFSRFDKVRLQDQSGIRILGHVEA